MDILKFASTVGKLKKVKRSGWVKWKVPNSESIADHIFRVAVLTMVLAPKKGLNKDKAVKMALVHDLGESIVGDLILVGKFTNVKAIDKTNKELAGIKELFSSIDSPQEYQQLFQEYEETKTPEAKFVKQIDILEMLLQAAEYENESKVNLSNYFETSQGKITDSKLLNFLQEIEELRPKK